MAGASRMLPGSRSVASIQACTASAWPMKCQPRANLWWPSSKTSGPPPHCSGAKRQASAAGGMGQESGLVAELLLMRMVSGSPISPASMSAFARITGG